MNEPLNFKLHVADLIKCAVGGVLKGKRCCLGSFNLRGCACDKSHQQSLSCEAETVFHAKITSYSRFKSSLRKPGSFSRMFSVETFV